MQLIENIKDAKVELIEEKETDKFLGTIKFEFAEYDFVNKNNRKYSKKVLDEAIEKLDTEKGVLGQSGHPKDGATVLDAASHLIKKFWTKGRRYWAEAKLLNTVSGRNIKTLSKITDIGASLRGFGEVKQEDGVDVIQEGYEIKSVDLVLNPSFDFAHVVTEEDVKEYIKINEIETRKYYEEAKSAGYKGSFEKYINEFIVRR